MANKHIKRCSMLLIIREMQSKTTMSYHLTLIRIVVIKKSTNNKFWRGHGEKGTLLHCWWEYKLVQPLWKTVWRFLKKKTRNKTTYDPAIPLLGIYTEETKIEKDICTPMFIAALFTIARIWSESHSVVSVSLQTHGLHSPWNFPGQNTEVDSLSLLQGIFPTQGSNPGHLHCRQILYQLSHQGSPSVHQQMNG